MNIQINTHPNKINAELAFHNIDLYPYDNTEDYDEEERMLNSSIRVRHQNKKKREHWALCVSVCVINGIE